MNIEDASIRLDAAEEALHQGIEIIREWLARSSHLVINVHPDVGHVQVSLKISEPPPKLASMRIAQFLESGRAALDYLAAETYRVCNPEKPDKRVYFPILSDEETWQPAQRGVPNASDEHVALFRAAQDEHPDNIMFLFSQLSNRGKHISLHMLSTEPEITVAVSMMEPPSGYGLVSHHYPPDVEVTSAVNILLLEFILYRTGAPDVPVPIPEGYQMPHITGIRPPDLCASDGAHSLQMSLMGHLAIRLRGIVHSFADAPG